MLSFWKSKDKKEVAAPADSRQPAVARVQPTSCPTMQSLSSASDVMRDRCIGSLLGFFIGDALAMPVHWYYDLRQLRSDFGEITQYEAPKPRFPGSIMNLSNTGGGGRGSDEGDIVGTVILHGKKKYWLASGQYHYHHGMRAGENTLDSLVTLVLIKNMVKQGRLDCTDFVNDYVQFMTTPGTHNDAYAGTCHRMFFKNMVTNVPLPQCPDNDSHNVDAIDALMIVPPIVWANLNADKTQRDEAITAAISCTRNCSTALSYAHLYGDMLHAVATGQRTVAQAAVDAGRSIGVDIQATVNKSGQDPMTACYITTSFPAMLYFAAKYESQGLRRMLLASVNAGGENVARSSLLGALMGASVGASQIDADAGRAARLRDGLVLTEELESVAANFAGIFCN
jgi:ADP-ribosyl-[dinitrogen reductase] hydrolase